LPDPERNLSLRHFEIELRSARHRLRNLSINGTTLNGNLLTDNNVEQVLEDGDVIHAGAYTLHVHLTPGPFAGLFKGADSWLTALKKAKSKQGDTDDPL
jgi:predicted component of type VI protein secretion system